MDELDDPDVYGLYILAMDDLGMDRDAPLRDGYTLDEAIRHQQAEVNSFPNGRYIQNAQVMSEAVLGYLKELHKLRGRTSAELVNDAAHRLISHTCPHCGKDFVPANPQARYCSTNCRVAAHRKKLRGGGVKTVPNKQQSLFEP